MNLKNELKEFATNLIKLAIIFIGATALIFVFSLLPETAILGISLPVFFSAVITVAAIMSCTMVTKRMFGSAVLCFVLPFISYFFVGLFSPAFIAVHIFCNFMMVFVYNLVTTKKESKVNRIISIGVAGFTRYGLLFLITLLFDKKLMPFVMIFKNISDEAGIRNAASLMKIDSRNGQFIATVIGVLISFEIAKIFIYLFGKAKAKKKK